MNVQKNTKNTASLMLPKTNECFKFKSTLSHVDFKTHENEKAMAICQETWKSICIFIFLYVWNERMGFCCNCERIWNGASKWARICLGMNASRRRLQALCSADSRREWPPAIIHTKIILSSQTCDTQYLYCGNGFFTLCLVDHKQQWKDVETFPC